jgi:hypothetical protein
MGGVNAVYLLSGDGGGKTVLPPQGHPDQRGGSGAGGGEVRVFCCYGGNAGLPPPVLPIIQEALQ